MIAQNEIRQMSFPDKLALLEAVWSEISATPDQIDVPQWHKDMLDERILAFENGSDNAIDWVVAKEQIKKIVR